MERMELVAIGKAEIRRHLTWEVCLPLVRRAMIELAAGDTRQILRQIVPLEGGRVFGVMAGALGLEGVFGAKLVSVFPDNFALGLRSHQGLVLIFDPASGAPAAILDAGEITAIRTAAASAVATEALARPGWRRLGILGYGEQARMHIEALSVLGPLEVVRIWGRSLSRTEHFAERVARDLGLDARPCATVEAVAEGSDVICTTTSAAQPILRGEWVRPGTHINLVGASTRTAAEADEALVARARFVPDHRASVLQQGGEFLRAKEAGLVDDDHVGCEIGSILSGDAVGRQNDEEITVYKSLGNVVQDLAAAHHLYERARSLGFDHEREI